MGPNQDYGILINSNIKLHRRYFQEMCKLWGINCWYKAPLNNKDYNTQGDLETAYSLPIKVGCIFQDHPDQKTLKKMGWVAELSDSSSIIHVPYDLQGLQVGAIFTIPSGIDNAPGRDFRVISMQNIMVYPASIACEIAPEWQDTMPANEVHDFKNSTANVLVDNEDDD